MHQPGKSLRRFVATLSLAIALCSTAGCAGVWIQGITNNAAAFSAFWQTTPPIPVSAYYSELIEDTYWEEERYRRVPILDPVEGEHAPLFCLDPPSDDEVIRALPDIKGGGVPFLAETFRNNVRIVVEPIVDRIDECRFIPMVGPARVHHCHYKCTVYYEKVIRSMWPVPFSHSDQSVEVVYIDHDHLIRCAGPMTPQ